MKMKEQAFLILNEVALGLFAFITFSTLPYGDVS